MQKLHDHLLPSAKSLLKACCCVSCCVVNSTLLTKMEETVGKVEKFFDVYIY